jgi:hypothetical protein
MGVTGWLGEAPDEVPPMPVTEMMLARQQRRAGPLETALARSAANDIREAREAAANAPDPDERAANLVSRGYTPGLASQLAQRLGDTMAEIEAENAKIEKGKRRQEHLHRAHAAGQITAWDIVRGQDFDEGDPAEWRCWSAGLTACGGRSRTRRRRLPRPRNVSRIRWRRPAATLTRCSWRRPARGWPRRRAGLSGQRRGSGPLSVPLPVGEALSTLARTAGCVRLPASGTQPAPSRMPWPCTGRSCGERGGGAAGGRAR